jgi:hypothetical protein
MDRHPLISHLLGPVWLSLGVAAVLWPFSYFFGIGTPIFEIAVGSAGLFAGMIAFIVAVTGLIWGAIKLFELLVSALGH